MSAGLDLVTPVWQCILFVRLLPALVELYRWSTLTLWYEVLDNAHLLQWQGAPECVMSSDTASACHRVHKHSAYIVCRHCMYYLW